jgi:hypothetical protein
MSTFTKQCQYCAFKLSEDQTTEAKARFIEDKYSAIRGIKNAPQKPRHIFLGGNDSRTETCFIDSPTWIKREEDIHCPDRLDNSLSLEAALALREARISNKFARDANKMAFDAKIWAIIAAIIATIAIIIAIWINK